jgi:hypothetical protein
MPIRNKLFLNNIILFKYCTATGIALPDGYLGIPRGPYSQSYPQKLWVSIFVFCSKMLKANSDALSSIGRQATEPA